MEEFREEFLSRVSSAADAPPEDDDLDDDDREDDGEPTEPDALVSSLLSPDPDGRARRRSLVEDGLIPEALSRCGTSADSHAWLSRAVSAAIAAEASDESSEVVQRLCRGLCAVHSSAARCEGGGDILGDLRHGGPLCEMVEDEEERTALADRFLTVATKAVESGKGTALAYPAVTLASALSDDRGERCAELLAATFASTNPSTRDQVGMARGYLSSISSGAFNGSVAPALGLKIRAHPDKVLPMAEAILSCLDAGKVDAGPSCADGAELVPSVAKHLRSAKAELRTAAWRTLVLLGGLGGDAAVAEAVAAGLKAGGGLTTSDHRAGGYASLVGCGRLVLDRLRGGSGTAEEVEAAGKLADDVLKSLAVALPKDKTASKSGGLNVREVGLSALLIWAAIARRTGATEVGSGYDSALSYLAEPLAKYTPRDGEFRLRLGSLVVFPRCDYLDGLTENTAGGLPDESFVEAVASDLFDRKSASKGLEAAVESAVKRSATSDGAQVDGALAAFLLVTYHSGKDSYELPAGVAKVVAAGSTAKGEGFLYAPSLLESARSDPLSGYVVHRTVALHVRAVSKSERQGAGQPLVRIVEKRLKEGHDRPYSAAAGALAACVACGDETDGGGTAGRTGPGESARTVATYSPVSAGSADALLFALFGRVNDLSLEGGDADGYDAPAVRSAALALVARAANRDALCRGLVLSHAGCEAGSYQDDEGLLAEETTSAISGSALGLAEEDGTFADALADFVVRCCSSPSLVPGKADGPADGKPQDKSEGQGVPLSRAAHGMACGLLSTLGGIGGTYDADEDGGDDDDLRPLAFAHDLVVGRIPPRLASALGDRLKEAEALTEEDVALYGSPRGVLYRPDSAGDDKKPAEKKKKAAGRKGKGGTSLEDEEWEAQVKRDLAKKKKAAAAASSSSSERALTAAEKEELAQQTSRRDELAAVLDRGLSRALAAVRSLCESDIEVGNSCLPTVGPAAVSAASSSCPAVTSIGGLGDGCTSALTSLAACVYEVDEESAPSMAGALVAARRLAGSNEGLPSPCPAAAETIGAMDEGNDVLSGNSFAFLFPVVRAALAGGRNVPGCEAALAVLDRHARLLSSDDDDGAASVLGPLRKDMASAVLGLLRHDRAISFADPTPAEALVSCYGTAEGGPALRAPEIAPLLGEGGALGTAAARAASMDALAVVAGSNPKLVKSNPLAENRVWLNCFAGEDAIRNAARRAWLVAHGRDGDDAGSATLDAPGKMYIVPLLPLLSHDDGSIATAAASSLAAAMGMHGNAERSIVKLCGAYIGSFPADEHEERKPAPSPFPVQAAPVAKKPAAKKKVIDTGLPKKTKTKKISSVSTSMAKITGGPAPKKSARTKKLLAKTVAPKQERTLDQSALMDQFKPKAEVKRAAAEEDSESKVAVRAGVLRAITAVSSTVDLDLPELKVLLSFLLAFGLGDRNDAVRNSARDAARDIVAAHGSSDGAISFFLPMFESVLSTGRAPELDGQLSPEKVPATVTSSDRRKEGVVLSLGSIALHLKGGNEQKVDGIVDMLLGALKTPSEDVQSSVALCLSKLMKKGRTQERVEVILNGLMDECAHGSSLASQRGAAYGISAVVKGSGIATLKKYEIVRRLEESCSNGTPTSKEGSLFAIELLSDRLKLLFEPYVIVLLPALLKAFSDSSDHVRSAADKAVSQIMGKLSGHGVKLVMPAVLEAFDDPEWRTKQASILMLGSMSHCAPKQLASCLPKVVPKLTEAFSGKSLLRGLTYTHPKVKSSAEDALGEICKVIKNPEISGISPTLVGALTDSSGTLRALEALIETEFVHAIDAPSLSIIVPVVHRGLRDRAATTKRYAALISGNICTMINDARDFVPYLPILLPDLKATLLDPIPDVRSISAKSLGSLTRGLGEATFPELRPWLLDTLRSDTGSSVERSGAAQGLSEILVASGARLTENVMLNEILPLKSHPKAQTREGVLWVLTFLPSALGQAFSSLIDESLPALLSGLADDNETVREVALRAGRVLVRSHGKANKDKILPSLEEGLSDEDYRIRVASLTLLGDLLGLLSGAKVGKANTDTQDDIRQAERAQAQIALSLGNETRKRVLSSLYLARSDTAAVVRQSAVQVWKAVVSVTVRTLREILSDLITQIVTALASGDPERTQVAGRCLGDIVQKLGDAVLPQIIPVLRDNLYDGDEYTRQGVCVGLAEVINCSSKEQMAKYIEILVKVVQDAISDEDDEVRRLASQCFQNLYNAVGARTLEEIVPSLLVAMESEDDNTKARALNGMTGILSVRSRELFPYIIPRLLKPPLTASHADALGSISGATPQTIHTNFNRIVPTFISELASFSDMDMDDEEKEREEAIRRNFSALCRNVDTVGVPLLISEISNKCTSDKESVRKESCWSYQAMIEGRKSQADYYEYVPVILRELLHRLNDDSTIVLKANQKALGALTTCIPAESLVEHLGYIKNVIGSMVSDARYRKGGVGDGDFFLPGLNIPKGMEPLLPIYQRGVLYGDAAVRETAATGLGELIKVTQTKFLAGPFLIKLTGPLLRIVGDRNPSNVKIAIVQTLGLILTKGGPVLRAFVPQFQTTFVKALSDPSRQVRIEAIKALALLMPLSTRVDPLIKELVSTSLGNGSSATAESAGLVAIQTATLEALAVVLKHGGKKVKIAESIPNSLDAGTDLINHEDDGVRESAAKVIGEACNLLGPDTADSILKQLIVDDASSLSSCSPETKHGMACTTRRIFSRPVGGEVDRETYETVSSVMQTLMADDKVMCKESACVALGAVLGSSTDVASSIATFEKSMLKCMDTKEELVVQQSAAKGLCIAAKLQPGVFVTQDGLALTNGALKMALSGAQRVQFSYNDFLWLALDVEKGEEGLQEYLSIAHFDSQKKMQQVFSKVLFKMKGMTFDDM